MTADTRGGRLWAELHAGLPLAQLALLLEACRITDRLDRLDAALGGREWLSFRVNDDVTQVTVVIDRVLAEARQQALALKTLLAELSRATPVRSPAPEDSSTREVATGIADLTARIAARRSPPSGAGGA